MMKQTLCSALRAALGFGCALGLGFAAGCSKSTTPDTPAAVTDAQLFDMAKASSGFVWYKNSDALLKRSALSGHTDFPTLKTRYNATAAGFLDATGKVKTGSKFSNGSLIVKDMYDAQNKLAAYSVMYKQSSDPSADANGWVWAIYLASGAPAQTATAIAAKGSMCVACHAVSGNIDYTLMNAAIP